MASEEFNNRLAPSSKFQNRTERDQSKVEKDVLKCFGQIGFDMESKKYQHYVELAREKHLRFALGGLVKLPRKTSTLSSGQPWLLFWITNTLELLKEPLHYETKLRIVDYLKHCVCPTTGAFCGGPYQRPHLAPCYASMMAITILGIPEAYALVNRKGLHDFIVSMKVAGRPGLFTMHERGESDMRAIYCAVVAADLANVLDDAVTAGISDFIVASQSYEGGIGAEPFGEAHGGFTYCGTASMCILNQAHRLNLRRLAEWLAGRQMAAEGGFQGRTNKLVDSCYSFWQGATFQVLQLIDETEDSPVFDHLALQAYILVACQSAKNGGLIDKPQASPDYYHTCYALSGLSIAQHIAHPPHLFTESAVDLQPVDPLYNAPKDKVQQIKAYFRGHPIA